MKRRGRWLLGALGVLALAVGLRALWPDAPDAAVPEPAAAAPAAPSPLPPGPPTPAADDLPPAVRRYLEANVYPPGTGRLTPEREDLLQPNRRWEGLRPIRASAEADPGAPVSFRLTADRYDVTGAEEVTVWLEAERDGRPHPLHRVEATVVREGRSGPEGDPVEVGFRRRGGRWEAELPLDEPDLAGHHGNLLLAARFDWAPGETHRETLRFFHTPADRVPARFDGRFLDYVRDGNLRVEVGVEVLRPGFYRFDANLYDAAGAPVAFTSFKGDLVAGSHGVPLEVFGRLLRDSGAAGPYAVRDLRGYRFVDGAWPDHETIPGPAPSWITGRYALGEFSEDPWESEHTRRMVELMLEDEAMGISLDLPALPPGP